MPELPEVECVRQGILENFLQAKVCKVWSKDTGNLLEAESMPLKKLAGQVLHAVERRGKFLLWKFNSVQFLVHLGMTGVWSANAARQKHTRLELLFEDGQSLTYTDPRQFGSLCVIPNGKPVNRWEALGPDAIGESFTGKYLFAICQKSRVDIKVFLMDQRKVAGVGNIYASEALFRAHIHPTRPASSLSQKECTKLALEVRMILLRSIENRGTTFSDYRLTNGRGGSFQSFLKVFQKAGEPCPVCHAPIQLLVQGGRSTFFCDPCQM